MQKGPDAFRTISEAAEEVGVPQHVLRFWETKFSFIRPMKRAGGRRFYRRQDIEVLRGVRRLLHEEGYTIKGVQRLHKEHGLRRLVSGDFQDLEPLREDEAEPVGGAEATSAQAEPGPVLSEAARTRLSIVLEDLESTRRRIEALLRYGDDPPA